MKHPAHIYAKALVEVLSDAQRSGGAAAAGEARIAENFLALVRHNGDEIHLRKILEEASRFARGKNGIRKVTIESARKITAAQRAMIGRLVKPDDVVGERIDPDLIAGMKITLNDELQFDGSLKNKLNRVLGS